MLHKAAVLYIDVTWEESLRKNRRRFNPDKPDRILEHGMEDWKMERLYREVDWEDVCKGDPQYLDIQGLRIPYVVFDNVEDVTTSRGDVLDERLEQTLGALWTLYRRR